MKKIISLFLIVISIVILSGCTEEEISSQAEGIQVSLNTLQGNNSVIMEIVSEVYQSDELVGTLDFDVYINKARSWNSIQMNHMGYQDYRFVLINEDQTIAYYEFDPHDNKYSENIFVDGGKENYVFLKASQGEFDLTKITFSIESIIEMVNQEALSLVPISSEDELLKDYKLYKLTFDLNYFIENDRTILDALYGFKVSELTDISVLKDVKQDVILGYDQETNEIKYFSYSQKAVMKEVSRVGGDDLVIKIFIESIGEQAEQTMESIENSDIFPNENNIKK